MTIRVTNPSEAPCWKFSAYSWALNVGSVCLPVSEAIVNSPSTMVAVRNDDVNNDARMLGTRTRNIVVPQPAPSDREASTRVRRSMARMPASSDRYVNGIARIA